MKTKSRPARSGETQQQAKIDPVLMEQLNGAAADAEPVQAVIMLRPDDPGAIVPPPERMEELAQQVLERAEKQTGTGAERVNVFRNLGSFAISAKPLFLRELIQQPEVASAMANKRAPQAYIPPIDVEPVKPGSSRGWSSPPRAEKKSAGRAVTSSERKTAKASKSTRASKSHK